jgi:hypothetical protein
MVVKPNDFPRLELSDVELGELVLSLLHLSGKSALRELLEWPVNAEFATNNIRVNMIP